MGCFANCNCAPGRCVARLGVVDVAVVIDSNAREAEMIAAEMLKNSAVPQHKEPGFWRRFERPSKPKRK